MPEKLTPPPLNIDAERSVLGGVLLDNKALTQIAQQLGSGDFFRPDNSFSQHGEIFSAMLHLADHAKPIDLVVLSEELQRRGQLERCGGAPYIASLADAMPRVSNVEYYARIVKEKATLRRIAHAAERARDLALSANGDAAALLSEIASLCVPVDAQPAWQGVFHSFDEFESSAPLNFAIDGFLQNDGATMIGGLSGHGKTLILLSIAKALLGRKGARLWDLFTVSEPAVRVMYLIPECSLAPFAMALGGDIAAIRELYDRAEGKARQTIDIGNAALREAYERLTSDEAKAWLRDGKPPAWWTRGELMDDEAAR